jgi:DNA-3-methyladenine glycosylase
MWTARLHNDPHSRSLLIRLRSQFLIWTTTALAQFDGRYWEIPSYTHRQAPTRPGSRDLPYPYMALPQVSSPSLPIRPLDRAFFARNPRRVARELLGKVLVRKTAGTLLTARIVEVEAYLGENDPAAHAAAGNTPRNSVLFGPPGHAYVYFIYGNHYCLNVSCEPEGRAGGVLFRALEPLSGVDEMAIARGITLNTEKDLRKLTSGPGRLCAAFCITRARDNGCDLTSSAGSLWIGDDGSQARRIAVTPRIGITKAAERPLRYIVSGNPFVSGPKSPRPLDKRV